MHSSNNSTSNHLTNYCYDYFAETVAGSGGIAPGGDAAAAAVAAVAAGNTASYSSTDAVAASTACSRCNRSAPRRGRSAVGGVPQVHHRWARRPLSC